MEKLRKPSIFKAIFLFEGHTQMGSGLTLSSTLRDHSLSARKIIWVLEIKPGASRHNASSLPTILPPAPIKAISLGHKPSQVLQLTYK